MSKVKLIFDLSKEGDTQEYLIASKAIEMSSIIWQFLRNSRKNIEWKIENSSEELDAFDAIELCFERFGELLEEHDVNIDKLVE